MKIKTILSGLLFGGVMVSGVAQASLIDRGGGLLYDEVLNITWLQDANYAKTSGYDSDGYMNWSGANTWAANLAYFDSVRKVTYTDWRLPSISPVNIQKGWDYSWSYDGISSDRSYNVINTNSELGYMYYVNLGLTGEYSTVGVLQSDFGIFGTGYYQFGEQANVGHVRNLQSHAYWSETVLGRNNFVVPESDAAWLFNTHVGSQYFGYRLAEFVAWAVRDGDVASVSIPEPSSLALLGLALCGLVVLRKTHQG